MNLSKVRGLFAGSGSAALNNPEVTQRVIELTSKPPTECCLLYIGTATYDSTAAMEKQTVCFKNSGVSVVALECTLKIKVILMMVSRDRFKYFSTYSSHTI